MQIWDGASICLIGYTEDQSGWLHRRPIREGSVFSLDKVKVNVLLYNALKRIISEYVLWKVR